MASRSDTTLPSALRRVARLELVSVRLEDAVVVVRLDVDAELVAEADWPPPELRAPEISFKAVRRSVNPWLKDADDPAPEDAETAPEVAPEAADAEASADAPTLCKDVRRLRTSDEN